MTKLLEMALRFTVFVESGPPSSFSLAVKDACLDSEPTVAFLPASLFESSMWVVLAKATPSERQPGFAAFALSSLSTSMAISLLSPFLQPPLEPSAVSLSLSPPYLMTGVASLRSFSDSMSAFCCLGCEFTLLLFLSVPLPPTSTPLFSSFILFPIPFVLLLSSFTWRRSTKRFSAISFYQCNRKGRFNGGELGICVRVYMYTRTQ